MNAALPGNTPATGTFRSLRNYNYRLWILGSLVSSVGTWMQRTAQDWLVLTELTDRSATALGIVLGLQFGMPLLLLPLTGWAVDRFDRRRLLIGTQLSLGLLALLLGLLTISGTVTLWQVYVFAGLLGAVSAFDAPARQTFVAELVGERDLSNAVALNSSTFNAARMLGPAVAGLLIAAIGTGWAFVFNGLTYAGVLASLLWLRQHELHSSPRRLGQRVSLFEGFSYLWRRDDLKTLMLMLALIGTFGLNFSIYISTVAVTVFHADAGGYGLLSSLMAGGSVAGALMAARREKPTLGFIIGAAVVFSLGSAVAALSPDYWLFGAMLFVLGVSIQTFTTSVNGAVQMATEPGMRGRVMAIHMAILAGGTPIGAPIVGFIVDHFGARWSLLTAVIAGLGAAAIGWRYWRRRGGGGGF